MPRVGFEPTIPVFERAKTVDALDRAAAVIDDCTHTHTHTLRKTALREHYDQYRYCVQL
jgi:hypothetical protein